MVEVLLVLFVVALMVGIPSYRTVTKRYVRWKAVSKEMESALVNAKIVPTNSVNLGHGWYYTSDQAVGAGAVRDILMPENFHMGCWRATVYSASLVNRGGVNRDEAYGDIINRLCQSLQITNGNFIHVDVIMK